MTVSRPAGKRLIVLELNELCPSLVDQFIAEGLLPNFKRLRERASTFITHTSDAKLEPWIQWVTLHTGVPLEVHGILDLDQADKLSHRAFWDAIEDDNLLLMSPMNVKFDRADQSIFLPDPWTVSQAPSTVIEPFFKFIRSAVQGHMRSVPLSAADSAAALRFLLRHGLSFRTVVATLRQFWSERMSSQDQRWRRATILDRLAWDVFAHFWNSARRPRVGVFFSNATAHYQHKYWRHHAPEAFRIAPGQADLENYQDAIRYGYRAHDRLVGRALHLAGSDCSIALCTALSQQPMRDYEERGGKAMFVPRNFATLFEVLGLPASGRAEQLMAEESRLHFETETECRQAHANIVAATTSEGHKLFATRGLDANSFILGCAVFVTEVAPDTAIVGADGARAPFREHFMAMPTVTSGKHHPDGLFWLASPSQARTPAVTRLPLTEVSGKLEQALGLSPALPAQSGR